MSFAPDILDPKDLQKRITDAASWGSSFELARLENANGAAATRVRDILRAALDAYKPDEQHDSAERKGSMLRGAVVCWEFARAERMAKEYEPGPLVNNNRGNCLGLWREAILGQTRGALAFLNAMPEPRYGNPPERRELAEGVLGGDAKLIRAGLKATSDRFKKAWRLKTWCTPSQLNYYGTAARMVPDVCRRLITHNWLWSDWAIAWMSLAWHRGLTGAFAEPELFSPWVQWELCCPEPNPSAGAKAASRAVPTRPRKRPGKIQLRAELFAAAACGNVKAIQNLIQQEVQLDTLNQDRQTALMVATHANQTAAVIALIQAGADVKLLDPKGRSALGIAADLGLLEIVRAILSCSVKPDLSDKPVSPLVRASRGGHLEIVQLLLKAGADPNRISAYGNSSALTDAIKKNHIEVVHMLVIAGADVNKPVEDDCASLVYAIQTGNLDLIRFLLKSGADVNARDWWGGNALHAATVDGEVEIVRQIIAAGAELDLPLKRDGVTPLMMSVPHPECLKLLLKAGANPTLRNKKKKTVFDLARDHPESLEILQGRGSA